MFSLRNFLLFGFKDAVGKMADYQVILNATGWYDKGVLLVEDLQELQTLIDEKNKPAPIPEIREMGQDENLIEPTEGSVI